MGATPTLCVCRLEYVDARGPVALRANVLATEQDVHSLETFLHTVISARRSLAHPEAPSTSAAAAASAEGWVSAWSDAEVASLQATLAMMRCESASMRVPGIPVPLV